MPTFPLKRVNNEVCEVLLGAPPAHPRFVDVSGEVAEFPFALWGDVTVTIERGGFPIVELIMLAEHVDADVEIPDITPPDNSEVAWP
ncbi:MULTISPECIES: hypothetical protein [unclassified Mycobacterium]|uniref:hypothetical protein n=1 Tax=unclassified Mycobacterium TaxID=2642494 RepID=UPI0029C753F2|nr:MULTISPECIES: hypothetical protein [unclassified Mycobacterium]